MGYVQPDKPDIFVSYAHVDDVSFPGEPMGWVTALVRGLSQVLAMKLGRTEIDIWLDTGLRAGDNSVAVTERKIEEAATVLLVLSPGYLQSPWCNRELDWFFQETQKRGAIGSRLFVIEIDRVERPPQLVEWLGYRFWVEDPDTGRVRTLGVPRLKPDDPLYYNRLFDLGTDLAQVLCRLKNQTQVVPEVCSVPGGRPAVFLAEPTDDLDERCDSVKRYLIQAGRLVLPQRVLPRDPDAFREAMKNDLEGSALFVQLLSESPGRHLPGADQRLPAMQYRLALASGKLILQWRPRDCDPKAVRDPEHRGLLQAETVASVDLNEFKQMILRRVNELAAPKPPAPNLERGDNTLVFVNFDDVSPDRELANRVRQALQDDIGTIFPPRDGTPESIRKIYETILVSCDVIMFIYGYNPEWIIQHWNYFRKVRHRRKTPLKAVVVCDGPPKDKESLSLFLPGLRLFNFRDKAGWDKPGWADQLVGFVKGL